MKYEIFQAQLAGDANMFVEIGVLHHDHLVHAIVAENMLKAVAESFNTPVENVKVVAAGFCSEGFPFTCWGESESMELSSRGNVDAAILCKSMLHFEDVAISPYDKIRWAYRNLADANCSAIVELRQQKYVLVNESFLEEFGTDKSHVVPAGIFLEYVAPSLDDDGEAVHIFRGTEENGNTRLLCFKDRHMASVFLDTPIIRELLNVTAFAMQDDDGEMIVCMLHSMADTYPLTTDHDEFIVVAKTGKERRTVTIEGTLAEIAQKMNVEVKDA